jgi:hypothetical protein
MRFCDEYIEGGINMNLDKLGKKLSKELKIDDSNKFYRLWTKPNCFQEGEIRNYNIPNAKTGLILMDALIAEYKELGITDVLIGIQVKTGQDGEWDELIDGEGNSIKQYEIDENFAIFLVE